MNMQNICPENNVIASSLGIHIKGFMLQSIYFENIENDKENMY